MSSRDKKGLDNAGSGSGEDKDTCGVGPWASSWGHKTSALGSAFGHLHVDKEKCLPRASSPSSLHLGNWVLGFTTYMFPSPHFAPGSWSQGVANC